MENLPTSYILVLHWVSWMCLLLLSQLKVFLDENQKHLNPDMA